jgi:hypothetical protein
MKSAFIIFAGIIPALASPQTNSVDQFPAPPADLGTCGVWFSSEQTGLLLTFSGGMHQQAL